MSNKGEAIFNSTIAKRLNCHFTQTSPQAVLPFPELAVRKREILTLVAQGLTNSAIAERLLLSPKTGRNQVSSLFSKLQVADRAEAIFKARRASRIG